MIAVTGANGYVGGCIAAALAAESAVLRMVREPQSGDDLAWSFDTPAERLAEALRSHHVSHIVHAAWDMRASRLAELERGCVAGSARLLEAAKRAEISGFTFISSISAFAGARSAYGKAKLQVEAMVLAQGGTVLRLGLVHGDGQGGMFGSLRKTLAKSRVIPLIGDGSAPQHLLHETVLAQAARAACRGDFAAERAPITLASPDPVPFRDILLRLAATAGRRVILIPIPWRVFYAGLWTAERLGLNQGFRSDSILSFVFQDPAPDFTAQRRLGLFAPR